MTYSVPIEIFEFDHYEKKFEDRRNNLYILELYNDIEEWLEKNLSNRFDIDCEDAYQENASFMHILFETDYDAMLFRMNWCKDPIPYQPNMYQVVLDYTLDVDKKIQIQKWLLEQVGENRLTWRYDWATRHGGYLFFRESDAALFKMVWG